MNKKIKMSWLQIMVYLPVGLALYSLISKEEKWFYFVMLGCVWCAVIPLKLLKQI